MKYLILEVTYGSDRTGSQTTQALSISNDLNLSIEELEEKIGALLREPIILGQYGLPNIAVFDYEWQCNGVDHCYAELRILGESAEEEHLHCSEPLSAVLSYMLGENECEEFIDGEQKALQEEAERLNVLLGNKDKTLVVTIDSVGRVGSLISDDDTHYSVIVLDYNCDSIEHDIGPDWHGDKVWQYGLTSYQDKSKVAWAKVLNDCYLNYINGDSFHLHHGQLHHQDGSKVDEVIYRFDDTTFCVSEDIVRKLNAFDWEQ
ncbi:hypothetical protein ACP3V3_02895 [Vibrio sp. PNB22_3_1]